MSMDMKLQMKLQQKLVMTPNLQLAIKLLQLTRLELAEVLEQNMLENPVLEVQADGDDGASHHSEDKSVTTEFETVRASSPEITDIFPDQMPDVKKEEPIRWEEIDEYLREEYDYGYMPREQKEAVPFENLTRQQKGLFDILNEQLMLNRLDEEERRVGLLIIGSIDDNGYLTSSIEEIATDANVPVEQVAAVLEIVQTFEPPGIAARDLKECMLIQIDQLYPDQIIARQIIENHLEDIEHNNFKRITESLGVTIDKVQQGIEVILSLEPKPGRKYSSEEPRYIIPDVVITRLDDQFVVLLNDEGIPRLRISNLYLNILKNKSEFNTDTRDYIEKKLNSARWLIKSIEQRQQTLYKVARSILKFQYEFFEKGLGFLKPLVLRVVAEDIGMHESTVSRVSTNKYMHTPRGVFELKYFFHSGLSTISGDDISSLRIKDMISTLIRKEDTKRPLSDKKIADILYQQGIQIARRTVAKYREELRIPPSSRRKHDV